MKKNFCKILAMAIVAIMMMSVSVFAAIDTPSVTDEVATVTISGLTNGEEATILVVKAGKNIAELQNSDIIYIDQMTVVADPADATGKNGIATFTLDASAAEEVNGEKKVDIYYGYSSMTEATTPLKDVVISKAAPTVVYGDVNDDTKVNPKDSVLLAQKIARMDVTINTANADVYLDGKINPKDSVTLAQKIARLIDTLPVIPE